MSYNEKEIWESFLGRKLSDITPGLLRELGEARVRELQDDEMHLWARMGAQHVAEIPHPHFH